MQINIDPFFLNKATKAFTDELASSTDSATGLPKRVLKLTRKPRFCTIVSRQTIDPTAQVASPVVKKMFLEADEFGSLDSFDVLTDEPRIVYGQATPADVALGVLANNWGFRSQEFFGADPTEANSLLGILSGGNARMDQGGAIVVGPRELRESLGGDLGFRVSEGTVAGELLGGVEGGSPPAFEPQLLIVPPTTTLKPEMRFNGALFAAVTPAVTGTFVLEWRIQTLVANIVGA